MLSFADRFERFDVLVEEVQTLLVLVPGDELEILLFVDEIQKFVETTKYWQNRKRTQDGSIHVEQTQQHPNLLQ